MWGPPISASLGAMRPLVAKLDKLLLSPPQGCSSKSVRDGMHLLKKDVEEMSSCLDRLSEVEDPPPTAKCWMNEARDLSYDMEDYIDSLLFVRPAGSALVANHMKPAAVVERQRNQFGLLGSFADHVIRRIGVVANQLLFGFIAHVIALGRVAQVLLGPALRHRPAGPNDPIATKVSEFRRYVQEAIERHKVYVVLDSVPSSTLTRRFVSLGPMLPIPMWYEDTVINGRMNVFIDSLANNEDQQLMVVSVFGSACLGKTTLARVLYGRIGMQFDCRAFIRVSNKPDMKRIFRDMLSQLQKLVPPKFHSEVDLVDNIKLYLRNKRYLIIIDDVWAASVWDIINHALPKGGHGSRVITTTQVEDVAFACCGYQSERVFEMKTLDYHYSKKLFFNRLFGSESYCPEQFKGDLNKIVEICCGLPLATIIIASFLASQPTMTEDLLEHIHESLSSCFSASERTRQALNLSFNNLPHYLKTCLLHLSMHPEGYTFCSDDLLKQWMAEGFIDATEGQDVKKIAESYLHQLIDRRFIQPICINDNNEVLSCAVHEAVHDLIAHKSAEENFTAAINYSQKNVTLSHKARRLSLLFGDARYAKTPANIRKSQVRSLRFSGSFKCMPSITEFKLLRILNLQLFFHGDFDSAIKIELSGISELFQLRYLKVASDLCIKFPDHMERLQRLETLDIKDAVVLNFSWVINLPHLLHLSLPFEKSLLHVFRNLKGASRLNYLEDLHLSSTFTTTNNAERSMEALASLIVGHGNLRTLVLTQGFTDKNTVVCGASVVFTSLDDLAPPPLLERLECTPSSGMTFSRIPKWVKNLCNLCILRITVRRLEMKCVRILRGSQSLTSLSLYVWGETSERITFDKAGFSALNYFKLRFLTGIAWIKFEEDAMPKLWKLRLVFNAIPPKNKYLFFVAIHPRHEQYKQGNALISIEHMPGLREISAKFGGAAADIEYALRTFVSNHAGNPKPTINNGQDGDQSTQQQQQQQQQGEILKENTADEILYNKRSRVSSSRLHALTLEELMYATDNFSAKTFCGDRFKEGFYAGSFKRNLRPGLAPQEVTVKCVSMFSDNREWLFIDQMELEHLGTICHPHLVKLLGFCDCYKHRMLVYEDMPRESLQEHLLNTTFIHRCIAHFRRSLVEKYMLPSPILIGKRKPEEWLKKLMIAVGAAKGLAFLHEADKPMFHGDFKASNILLDSDGTIVKLFGFGLATQNDITVPAEMKSDVYNFGVVLLELLTGRPSINKNGRGGVFQELLTGRLSITGQKKNLVTWSLPYLLSKDKLHHIMDPELERKYSLSGAWSTAKIACWCLTSVPEERPSMRLVVEALEPLLELSDDDEVWDHNKPSERW